MIAYFVFYALFAEDSMTGRVKAVIDGNTLEIETKDNEIHTVQLVGIDCPELGQSYGDFAKTHLEKLALEKKVEFVVVGKDRWGNRLATVTIKGTDIRFELLKEGLAWTSERNPEPELETIKEEARKNTKGLWKESNPTPPWVYRRKQTMLQPKES